jgi:hypothetical protein
LQEKVKNPLSQVEGMDKDDIHSQNYRIPEGGVSCVSKRRRQELRPRILERD